MPPPPSRPRYNNNYDIETNHITNDNDLKNGVKHNNKGFFVDVPPKFYKSSAKQQFYQQQYLNDVFSKNYYSKASKYSIIAFKDKYRGLPYYVVSHLGAMSFCKESFHLSNRYKCANFIREVHSRFKLFGLLI